MNKGVYLTIIATCSLAATIVFQNCGGAAGLVQADMPTATFQKMNSSLNVNVGDDVVLSGSRKLMGAMLATVACTWKFEDMNGVNANLENDTSVHIMMAITKAQAGIYELSCEDEGGERVQIFNVNVNGNDVVVTGTPLPGTPNPTPVVGGGTYRMHFVTYQMESTLPMVKVNNLTRLQAVARCQTDMSNNSDAGITCYFDEAFIGGQGENPAYRPPAYVAPRMTPTPLPTPIPTPTPVTIIRATGYGYIVQGASENLQITKPNLTRAEALALCNQAASEATGHHVRCRWNGEVIFDRP